ncbi:MAG: TetR/AcrR family transcriptional regulator [Solirubrobacteraceae bacterium]
MAVRPSRPQLRDRYDRRREELVRQAARTFARRGYDQTTMQELAATMGLATGALYHYFPGKERLLIAICDQLMEPLLGRAAELAAADASAHERLKALVRLWVSHVVAHRDHMLVFQQERHQIESGEDWRGVRAARKAFERLVADLLDRALQGEDSQLRLLALLGMVNHTAQWYRARGPLSPLQIADGYLELVLAPG